MNLKDWIFSNFKWILTLVVIGVSNYFLLANKIDANTKALENKLNKEEAHQYIDDRIRQSFDDNLKFYFSDTDGQVLKTEVNNLKEQIDRFERLLDRKNKQ